MLGQLLAGGGTGVQGGQTMLASLEVAPLILAAYGPPEIAALARPELLPRPPRRRQD
jgi:hypothetical protein